MTAAGLEVLAYYYHDPKEPPQSDEPQGLQEIHKQLLRLGLLDKDNVNSMLRITAKGRAHIRQLCHVSLPKQIWASNNGRPIPEYEEEEDDCEFVDEETV